MMCKHRNMANLCLDQKIKKTKFMWRNAGNIHRSIATAIDN